KYKKLPEFQTLLLSSFCEQSLQSSDSWPPTITFLLLKHLRRRPPMMSLRRLRY
ncbi:hypothetical protein LINGRAHAP2_LOCUS15483, partial [Linum grandiflorum]